MAAVEHLLMRVRLQRMFRKVHQPQALHALQGQPHGQCALYLNTAQFGRLSVFRQHP